MYHPDIVGSGRTPLLLRRAEELPPPRDPTATLRHDSDTATVGTHMTPSTSGGRPETYDQVQDTRPDS